MRYTPPSAAAATLIAFAVSSAALAQAPPRAEQTSQPATSAPAQDGVAILATVIEVYGDVRQAPLDANEWKPVKLNDQLPARTRLLTGIRSSAKLRLGDEEPYTCLLVEQVGLTILSELSKTAETKTVRVGVGHGRIRAGVAEGGLKSEFTVDSPVATLSKRGTWGFSLFYERPSDYFVIALTERGQVRALSKLTGASHGIQPREHINSAMRRWLDESSFDRTVPIPDILGQGDIDVAFNRLLQDGLGVLGPGQGRFVLINLSSSLARAKFAQIVNRSLVPIPGIQIPRAALDTRRVEGFFGTGRGDELIDVLIETTNPLVQKGLARPGKYRFRRAALQRWLKDARRR